MFFKKPRRELMLMHPTNASVKYCTHISTVYIYVFFLFFFIIKLSDWVWLIWKVVAIITSVWIIVPVGQRLA
jgi:hypothetical protein